jgi:adenosine deaminase CECR1
LSFFTYLTWIGWFMRKEIGFLAVMLAFGISLYSEENISSSEVKLYLEKREEAMRQNRALSILEKEELSEKEEKVNNLLSKMRADLYVLSVNNLLTERNQIDDTELFSFLRKMPKGGLLHVHSASLIQSNWLVEELTTMPNCYVYWAEEGATPKGTLHFFEEGKAPEGYQLVEDLRSNLPNFDKILLSLLKIKKNVGLSAKRWKRFEGWFTKTAGLIHYKPAFLKYYKYTMQTLIDDNLQYMELRALNTPIYNLDGSKEDPRNVVDSFLRVRNEIHDKHPEFDFKLIHTDFRHTPKNESLNQLELAYQLRSLYPNFIIGYDLVGEEDTGRTTLDYIDELLEAKAFERKYGIDLPYYFHNGESNWAFNNNLFDAVLLKSKRIGHGLNLFHYPYLLEKIKEEDICLEICPISNQILGYVADLRIHPGAHYLRAGIPCVISSDDPGLFGYHGVTPDLWEAVVAWDLDLQNIKQLCKNSLIYSGMSEDEKKKALEIWSIKWEEFILSYSKESVEGI